MKRREFLSLLWGVPYIGRKSGAMPDRCPICGSLSVYFDNWIDVNLCAACGAQETRIGWVGK